MEVPCVPPELILSPSPAPTDLSSGYKDQVKARCIAITEEEDLSAPSTLRGYLWKFPSEGTTQDSNAVDNTELYPRKCRRCLKCWVSDPDNESFHASICQQESRSEDDAKEEIEASRLGPARRVYCEINTEQSNLQWRYDEESESWSDVIPLSYVREAKTLADPHDSFLVRTFDMRRLVFQVRLPSIADSSASESHHSATAWCDLLVQLCALESIGDVSEADDLDDDNDINTFLVLSPDDAAEINKLISNGDVEGLDRELQMRLSTLDGCQQQLVDENQNSLMLLTLKSCPDDVLSAMIECTVGWKVDCNLVNREMESPLLVAAASGNAQIVHQLLQIQSIDANQRAQALGALPLHVAANSGCVSVIELICQHGADPYAIDANSWTALHYAAACETGVMAVHFFCELAPDIIDWQCSDGNTALHVAAACGCVENVRALLETAATPTITNAAGQTAYRLALENNKIQCALAINEYQLQDGLSGKPEDDGFGIGEYLATADSTRSSVDDHTYFQLAGESVTKHPSKASSDVLSDCWIECITDEGLPYYYNPLTGVSSWFKETTMAPNDQIYQQQLQQQSLNDEDDSDKANAYCKESWSASETEAGGQELPLCLIPMVSPLTSLDDPTAAVKLTAQRQKARALRRQHHVRRKTNK